MGPIETYFATIAVIFVFIGIARGYGKELGSTIIILVIIFLLLALETRIERYFFAGLNLLFPSVESDSSLGRSLLAWLYTLVFVSSVFASYSGRTLRIGGSEISPPGRTYISALVGLVNGYLVAGSLWYFQEKFDYPFRFFGQAFEPDLSSTAQTMVELLPQKVAPSPAYLMIPIAFLLLMRARG